MIASLSSNYRKVPSKMWPILAIQFVMNASHFMVVPLLAVYLASTMGLTSLEVGTVMAANLLSAQVLPVITGSLADRFNAKRFLIGGLAMRSIGLIVFAYVTDWRMLMLAATIMGTGVALYDSGLYAIFGRQDQKSRTQIFLVNNQMLNAGVIVGPLLAAIVSHIDIRLSFVCSAALFAVLALGGFAIKVESKALAIGGNILRDLKNALRDPRLIRLIICCSPWYFLFAQLYVSFPLYYTGIAGPNSAPIIFLANGIAGIVFMFASMAFIHKLRPATTLPILYVVAAAIYALVPVTQMPIWFLVFVVLYTGIETLMLPMNETLVAEIAPIQSQSTYFGIVSAASAIVGAGGYYIGSWLVMNSSALLTWLILSAISCLGFALSTYFKRALQPNTQFA
ncbi:putative Multidrug resistance protein mdtH [Pseudomonas coronafaciens pv. oryzae]|uniref:MFS transporter n=1 Tax=Pseudomonas coronafaciens TaxID=53409 RepID=UPI0006E65029|nr:MFS transporter [Pseudomonas coronafaciens]KPY04339.1 putative Multidrug resistance protein mdtH [Pseudomonas coronafaciens pv. oryzae]RMS98147.1 putative Multidrug resistance protein mdtH [Pseudomonas coronafaciens pv. oryzae]